MKVSLKGFTQNIMQRNRDRNLKRKKKKKRKLKNHLIIKVSEEKNGETKGKNFERSNDWDFFMIDTIY